MLIPAVCVVLALISLAVFGAIAYIDRQFSGKFFGYTALFTAILAFWFIYV